MGGYGPEGEDGRRTAWMRRFVEDVAARQETRRDAVGHRRAGARSAIFAAAAAPVVFAPTATAMGVEEPRSTATGDRYAEQVRTDGWLALAVGCVVRRSA